MFASIIVLFFFFFQAEDGIRDLTVTGVQTCALPILIRARVAKGLSQSDLAASSGIAPAQISRYEADKNQPRLHILRKLAAALDIAPDRQLAGDDEAWRRGPSRPVRGRAAPGRAGPPARRSARRRASRRRWCRW